MMISPRAIASLPLVAEDGSIAPVTDDPLSPLYVRRSGVWVPAAEKILGTESQGNITLAVDVAGLDVDPTRPARIVSGDWSAKPFATIQAAIDALPKTIRTPDKVDVNVGAGSFPGFLLSGFVIQCSPSLAPTWFRITGTRQLTVPATGPVSGTATSGGVGYLTLTSAGWTADDLVGKYLVITAGLAAGSLCPILSNTTDTIQVGYTGSTAFNSTSVFQIENVASVINSYGPYSAAVAVSGNTASRSPRIQDFKVSGLVESNPIGFFTTLSNVRFTRCVVSGLYLGFQYGVGHASIFLDHCASISTSYAHYQWGAPYAVLQGFVVRGGAQAITLHGATTNLVGCRVQGCTMAVLAQKSNMWGSGDLLIESCTTGINASLSDLHPNEFGGRMGIDNCITPFSLSQSRLVVSGALSGSGNTGWGLNANGPGNLVELGITPTITGTLGEVTVDGATDVTWAALATLGTYAVDAATGARIYRA
jgi:hypothetical protein